MNINKSDKFYESVHNYTKFKIIEMLIDRLNKDKLSLDNLNSIEDLADDVLKVLAMCGLKYYKELNEDFDNENRN